MSIQRELSEPATALLRYRLETKDNRVTAANIEAYRELAKAGIMFPVSGFASGPEASFRFTDQGWRWVNEPANLAALPAKSPEQGLSQAAKLSPAFDSSQLLAEPQVQTRYTLEARLAQCNPKAPCHSDDSEWLNDAPVGNELI